MQYQLAVDASQCWLRRSPAFLSNLPVRCPFCSSSHIQIGCHDCCIDLGRVGGGPLRMGHVNARATSIMCWSSVDTRGTLSQRRQTNSPWTMSVRVKDIKKFWWEIFVSHLVLQNHIRSLSQLTRDVRSRSILAYN